MPKNLATASALISFSSSIKILSRLFWSKGIVTQRHIAIQEVLWYNGTEELRNRIAELRLKMLESTVYVYSLYEEVYGEFLYVGLTKNLPNRYKNHCKNPIFYSNNNPPQIFILETTSTTKSPELERFWIRTLIKSGYKLLNRSMGGEINHKPKTPFPDLKDCIPLSELNDYYKSERIFGKSFPIDTLKYALAHYGVESFIDVDTNEMYLKAGFLEDRNLTAKTYFYCLKANDILSSNEATL